MTWLRSAILGCCLLGLLATCSRPALGSDEEPPAPQPIKFNALVDRLKNQWQGKVVVVDFWSDSCLPCKRDFPQLVALHRKLHEQGLICASVNLDDPKNSRQMRAAAKFLADQKANFDHFVLDEEPEVVPRKLGFAGPPAVFVFDRTGKLARRFDGSDDPDGEVSYKAIEELVVKLLK
ncbi:MAG TPA: TlpA disulfide reductase family protein [Gemmatales bacterium]|nr:TlpA disulfide reductase family protein [Gemmatales bacterium]